MSLITSNVLDFKISEKFKVQNLSKLPPTAKVGQRCHINIITLHNCHRYDNNYIKSRLNLRFQIYINQIFVKFHYIFLITSVKFISCG